MSAAIAAAARHLAKEFIRPYVERGDTYESLVYGCMGEYSDRGRMRIGSFGFVDCRAKRSGDLTIGRVGDVDCCFVFSLRLLYDEIRAGREQLSLFGTSS